MSAPHIRKQGSRRSPHRPGRITPENVLDRDPRRHTLCGAEATDRDLDFRSGVRAAAKGGWPICADCAAVAGAEQVS